MMSQKVLDHIKPGVVYGDDLKKLFEICKSEGFALPAVNCVNTESVNGVMEAAAKVKVSRYRSVFQWRCHVFRR